MSSPARGAWRGGGLAAVATAILALALPSGARALTCPNLPLPDRLKAADAAFVGRVLAIRTDGAGGSYRFDVRQRVKGPVGTVVEIESAEPLTDAQDHPLVVDAVVGVFAELDGATLTTTSCLLTDPAALLAEADHPKGMVIKVVIGTFILLGVVGWAIVRRRRGIRPYLPGAPGSTPR